MEGQSILPKTKRIHVSIEPFGLKHDRTGFVCGNSYIDAQLQRSIIPLLALNLTRAFVAVEPGSNIILGFYALNSHSIEAWRCPPEWESLISAGTLGAIPAAYISLFATRQAQQGRGIGRAMMADALSRIKIASQTLGTFAVVLDAADQKAFDFYATLGFQSIEQDLRMFLPITAIA